MDQPMDTSEFHTLIIIGLIVWIIWGVIALRGWFKKPSPTQEWDDDRDDKYGNFAP